jgi:hypothetical protein
VPILPKGHHTDHFSEFEPTIISRTRFKEMYMSPDDVDPQDGSGAIVPDGTFSELTEGISYPFNIACHISMGLY